MNANTVAHTDANAGLQVEEAEGITITSVKIPNSLLAQAKVATVGRKLTVQMLLVEGLRLRLTQLAADEQGSQKG